MLSFFVAFTEIDDIVDPISIQIPEYSNFYFKYYVPAIDSSLSLHHVTALTFSDLKYLTL